MLIYNICFIKLYNFLSLLFWYKSNGSKDLKEQPTKIHKPDDGLLWAPRYSYDVAFEREKFKDEKSLIQMSTQDNIYKSNVSKKIF